MLQRIRDVRRSDDRGFTLVELLIVIVILGVLAGIVVFSVSQFNDKGKASACKADVKAYEVAVEAYYAQKGSYPNDVALLVPGYLKQAHVAGENGYTITLSNDGKGTVTSTPANCAF